MSEESVSIVLATNRPESLDNIFANYERQLWKEKELIIILNNDTMDLETWKKKANVYRQVSVFQLPEETLLGDCLNFGVEKAKYPYIAKMDDDDYYGPLYLTEAMTMLKQANADVVGKRTCFMYLKNEKELRLRFAGREKREVSILQGATIFTTKKLLQVIPFGKKNLGECLHFLKRCKKKGYKIYSSSCYNFAIVRNHAKSHTWRPSNKYLSKTSRLYTRTESFAEIVNVPMNN
ncbi:glycosyltransferase family 2 protein [Bacillus sp. FJAT-27251]|uniref:glycosyltransferase n=1 Tax=Bacillus sp. FJAT-27251 TaxID=1684142 RepID=UPI0006A7ED73|nr:glycosyltransferase family 2 protein [Bacillus sp. FJAT-27251]